MGGDTTKAHLWADADVYIADSLDADVPASVDDEFGVDWDLVGLLDGDAGFVHGRSEDKTDHYAWGGILVRTGRKHFKATEKFTALEDNLATRKLFWPGSTSGQLIVPKPANIKLALETREGDVVHRLITKNYAQVEIDGDVTENESDLTKYPLIATIFPDADGVIWIEQPDDEAGS